VKNDLEADSLGGKKRWKKDDLAAGGEKAPMVLEMGIYHKEERGLKAEGLQIQCNHIRREGF